MIPVVKEKIKVKLALTIPTELPIVLVNEIIDTPLVVALKTINILPMSSKTVTYLLNFYCILLLISIINKTIFQFFLFHVA